MPLWSLSLLSSGMVFPHDVVVLISGGFLDTSIVLMSPRVSPRLSRSPDEKWLAPARTWCGPACWGSASTTGTTTSTLDTLHEVFGEDISLLFGIVGNWDRGKHVNGNVGGSIAKWDI